VSGSARFPELFAHQYATGEVSGKLDETLHRLHAYYQEEGTRKLRAFTQWTPRAIYLGVAVLIAYKVIGFYAGYFQQVHDAAGW
jgi:type II secretory pathway component PulF